MALLSRRNFIAWSAIFLMCLYLSDGLETTTMSASDEDDSSSEETIEDSNEGARRKRHAPAPVTSDSINIGAGDQRAGLPVLPDPATILRIAEILQTVGEKVIPILVQGNTYATERIGQEFQFLNKFKKDIDQFTQRTLGSSLRSSNNNSSST